MKNQEIKYFLLSLSLPLSFSLHYCLLLKSNIVLSMIIIILLYKMKFQKIINLLDITYDDKDLPRYITKK